jgi:hypothetical protein
MHSYLTALDDSVFSTCVYIFAVDHTSYTWFINISATFTPSNKEPKFMEVYNECISYAAKRSGLCHDWGG